MGPATRRTGGIGLVLAALVVLGGWAAHAQPRPSPPTRDQLRDRARLVLEEHCGQCHIGAYDTALPRALAVFDLGELEWSARMTVPQLIDTESRVREGRGPEGEIEIADEQVAIVAEYVRIEISRIGPE